MNVMIALELYKIKKIFGEGETAVVAVGGASLKIEKREIVLIMGPSGSGKTTLLSIAGGILRPTEGRVKIKGKIITNLEEKDLPKVRRENFGFIFQSFNLLASLTARENVELAANLAGNNGQNARKKAESTLKGLGLAHRLNAVPAKLSGGEKQRVAIARALINDPEVILADEPTANLDSKMGHEIIVQLRRIAKEENRSVLIVSHDNRIREVVDRVLWLEDGRFKEIGQMAIDLVCEMSVEKGRLALEYKGRKHYFCSSGCLKEFKENPKKYLKKRMKKYD